MTRFAQKEITRFAPGEKGIAQFALQVVSILVGDGTHVGKPPRPELLEQLITVAMTGDADVLAILSSEFRRLRIPADVAVDTYIPAAVAQIGDAWHNDEIDILDATLATCRLQNLVREFGRAWNADSAGTNAKRAVLMVVPEGEQHTLGTMIATTQLRRQGVSVSVQLAPSRALLTETMQNRRYDGVFLSVANLHSLEAAANIVKTVKLKRRSSMPIVVGGAIVAHDKVAHSTIGADMTTRNVREALEFLGHRTPSYATI
jgi:MerR family transcriptional regulator, light-induced transcriptional regulator